MVRLVELGAPYALCHPGRKGGVLALNRVARYKNMSQPLVLDALGLGILLMEKLL
jgi:hypothetical protein